MRYLLHYYILYETAISTEHLVSFAPRAQSVSKLAEFTIDEIRNSRRLFTLRSNQSLRCSVRAGGAASTSCAAQNSWPTRYTLRHASEIQSKNSALQFKSRRYK